jgi:serine-type D-Ala-D-Ala carboxypeptidase (penicillin-binding protein 5/6)
MQLPTPFFDEQKLKIARRFWRPAVGVAAVAALAVSALALPGHKDTPVEAAAKTSSAIHEKRPDTRVAIKDKVTNYKASVSIKTWGKAPKLAYPSRGSAAVSVLGAEPIGSRDGGTVRSTASVAKAMTALVVLRDHPLKPGWYGPKIRITRAEAAAFGHQARQGQSLVPVRAGELITERDALEALLLASANNMAQILARWDAGSVSKFFGKMNATAKSLGMTHTHYTDPSGFTATTKSTATDQLKLAEAAMKRWDYRGVSSLKSAWIPVKGHIVNFNKLLANPAVVGLKTGSMSAAGGCLLFAAKYKIDGRWVMVLGDTFGQTGPSGILHAAWDNSATLLASARKALRPYKIVWKGRQVGTVPGLKTKLVATKDVKVIGFSGMTMKGSLNVKVAKTTKPGAVVGKLTIAGTSVPVATAK